MSGYFFFFQAEDGIRDLTVTGVQTCALPILREPLRLRLERLCLPHSRRGARDLVRSEEHTSELQSQSNLVCRLLLEKKKMIKNVISRYNHLMYPLTMDVYSSQAARAMLHPR